jgi:hypothetical protein
MAREERAVHIALKARIHIRLARGDPLQPIGIGLGIERFERFHVGGRPELARGLQFVRRRGVDDKETFAVAFHHRVDVKDLRRGGVKAHQRRERAFVQFRRVLGRIQQLPMQVAVNDAGRDLGHFRHVRAKHFEPCLLRQPLRNRNHHEQHGKRRQRHQPEDPRRNFFELAQHRFLIKALSPALSSYVGIVAYTT